MTLGLSKRNFADLSGYVHILIVTRREKIAFGISQSQKKLIEYSIVLFIVAGVFGIGVLLQILLNKEASKPVIFIHIVLAIAGLILLTCLFMNSPHELYWILGLFWVAAIVGVSNLAIYSNKGQPSRLMALIHTGLGFASLATLVVYYFSK